MGWLIIILRRSRKYIKIPDLLIKSTFHISIFVSVFHASLINSFLQNEQLIIDNQLMIPSIRLTSLVPLRRINLLTVWNAVERLLNGETKGLPVWWNMTSDYNGVLNNNASKTNRCPEKPHYSDKNVFQNTTIIHNHH